MSRRRRAAGGSTEPIAMSRTPPDLDRNWGARCTTDLVVGGHRAAVLENSEVRVTVLTGKGSDVVELLHKPTDTDFLWRAPRNLGRAAGAADSDPYPSFLDQYLGGWHEMLPSFGPGRLHGAPAPVCGEVTLLPWRLEVERDSAEEVCVRLSVRTRRFPLLLVKRLRMVAGQPTLLVEETVRNEGGHDLDFAWGHHVVLGPGFLRPECEIEVPNSRIVAKAPGGPEAAIEPGTEGRWPLIEGLGEALDLSRPRPYAPGWEEDLCFPDVVDSWVGVSDRERGIGLGLAWEREVFPHLWMWLNYGGRRDYPWYGRTYSLGLEPISSLPFDIEDVVAAGTQLSLPPRGEISTRLCATVYEPSAGPVAAVEPDGHVEFTGRP